ncbi:hypothetical protein HJC23_006322 [Cyclotella cryptica]|uniref:DEAD-box helicase OB fold domain-containing protein n=1 Tax=Cyclotella cryptica TaxID=29204 RepID=A0ABD3PA67_9STRA
MRLERKGHGMNDDSSCAAEMSTCDVEITTFSSAYVQLQDYPLLSSSKAQSFQRLANQDLLLLEDNTKQIYEAALSRVHSTSFLFGRNLNAKCVVYTELLQTSKLYIRGVTKIQKEWIGEQG